MSEVFMTQSNIDLKNLLSLTPEEASKISAGYSAASHTLIDDTAMSLNDTQFFMTGNPFRNYIKSQFSHLTDGNTLVDQINVGVAEKRLLSEIYMSRNSLGLMSFSSGRTYEKTIHLPAVRRLLEAQGYETDEISSMIDYMKKSFAYDASPELKAAFEEMDSIYDRLGGLRKQDLHSLSERLGAARLRVLAPNMTQEQIAKFDPSGLGAYQYKFVFSETENARKPIQRFFCRSSHAGGSGANGRKYSTVDARRRPSSQAADSIKAGGKNFIHRTKSADGCQKCIKTNSKSHNGTKGGCFFSWQKISFDNGLVFQRKKSPRLGQISKNIGQCIQLNFKNIYFIYSKNFSSLGSSHLIPETFPSKKVNSYATKMFLSSMFTIVHISKGP